MRLPGFAVVLLLISVDLLGQNLLGYSSGDIVKYLKKNSPEMIIENNFTNDHYKYLKFTDGKSDTRTAIFFLSEKDRCTSIKLIYDLSMREQVIAELDNLYEKRSENQWFDSKGVKNADIIFKDEEWFLTVSIKPEKKD